MDQHNCFYFIRHGETDWNIEERFQGRSDIALNETGVWQARRAALVLQHCPIQIIVSSPMFRARDTAQIIATALNLPVEIDPGLVECDFGSLEGCVIHDVMQHFGISERQQIKDILPADGEQWPDLCGRSRLLLETWLGQDTTQTVLFVGDDLILQSISEQLCGHWCDAQHCVPQCFTSLARGWNIQAVSGSDTEPLTREGS